ncbi:Ubiquitin carboxyl-terminal hydrolase 21 [Chionoecetes opilio]|uniref:ubiquitinyl hydrolase 1 n=1 Tax=Chionoecetes opilio TaxID=41210 RepID=A0A8J5CKY0_CHIOP|nr:Ubiquitin carboxyl-terminal hydrolase 21 [Chionoecetes opilio]
MEQSLMWQCDACGKEHDCVQKTSMLSPPQLLIIHLSRYPGSQLHNKKLVVTFPERGLIFPSHQERQERTKEYQLYALCDHKGSMSFGHYTAICRTSWTDDASNWMFFSDTMVKPYSLEEALGHHTAHILFYRAVN